MEAKGNGCERQEGVREFMVLGLIVPVHLFRPFGHTVWFDGKRWNNKQSRRSIRITAGTRHPEHPNTRGEAPGDKPHSVDENLSKQSG
ncbi:hypothetical protein EYF80_027400 [Liparis tanakae]|uniref:Uncharacterized protein n=1 Tax=Liparis tanakae TaxID=230148 RepID=A0A4Z2H994_9TELE|nr:hypothetical protein EYF80_027400 [Liparis tanakae]